MFSPGGKVKLYRVKSEAPAPPLTSGNSNFQSNMFWNIDRRCLNTTNTFNFCSGVQPVSSSVQIPVTLSSSTSSSSSSAKQPVSDEAREKLLIKQVFGSDDKSLGEHLCF